MKAEAIQTRNTIFWIVIAIFAAMVAVIAIGGLFLGHKLTMFLFASLLIIFGVLAVVLAVLSVRAKEPGIRKLFFVVTGISAAGIPVCVILHNLVFALCVKFGWAFWGEGGDEAVFFILAIFVFPGLFVIGSLGSIVILIRARFRKKES
jgi:hypothetical protein